jgi:hypothetical protein
LVFNDFILSPERQPEITKGVQSLKQEDIQQREECAHHTHSLNVVDDHRNLYLQIENGNVTSGQCKK